MFFEHFSSHVLLIVVWILTALHVIHLNMTGFLYIGLNWFVPCGTFILNKMSLLNSND